MKHEQVLKRLVGLYMDLIAHKGFGGLQVDVRILKRGQKEVIINCGKQYRFVVDETIENDFLIIKKEFAPPGVSE